MSMISVHREGAISRITLDRPEKLNAFSADLVAELHAAVEAAESEGTRLLILRGAGKGFSGGFDLSEIESASDGDLLLRFVQVEALLQAVHYARVATLAMAHGPCYGAGADLFAACQWRIAAPSAKFRMPGARFGLVLGTRRLARLVGADQSRALLLRERPFDAETARASGFASEVAAETEWDACEERIFSQIESLDPETSAALNARLVDDTRDADLAALVRSAARGSIKARTTAYLQDVRSKRTDGR